MEFAGFEIVLSSVAKKDGKIDYPFSKRMMFFSPEMIKDKNFPKMFKHHCSETVKVMAETLLKLIEEADAELIYDERKNLLSKYFGISFDEKEE